MPTISKKGHHMPASPIRKLVPFAEQAIENGKKIYHLNIGQPDIKTPEVALNAVLNNTIDILSYDRSEGSDTYRKKLAKYYLKHNIEVTHKDILVTTGASEALFFLFNSIMDPKDEVIICEPFYANYIAFSNATGVNVVPAVCNIDDNFAPPSVEDLEKLITPKTKAFLICNPGNPTGYSYSKEEIEKLAALCLKYDLFLVADEVYREFVYDGDKHNSIMHAKGIDQNAIIIDSVSKRYSMCGARVGCLVSKNKIVMETVLKFAQARLSPPSYGLIASEAALDTPQRYFDDIIKEYVERRDLLIAELKKIKGIKVATPKGAFYCMVELPVKNTDHFAQWLLEHHHVNNETVMVAPASGFYSTPGIGLNQIRIAYVLNKESLIKAVHILEEALKVLQRLMQIKSNISLKAYNTFGIDVKAKHFVSINHLDDLMAVLSLEEYPEKLVLGGGSNMLLTKNFEGLVIHINLKGINRVSEDDDHVLINANAGENWHEFVLYCIANNYGGIENLSLIPGNVGTTPVQNIGAYGVELKDVFHSCQAIALKTKTLKTFSKTDCNFDYRNSIFKEKEKGNYIITNVTFKLSKRNHNLNINYGAISSQLELMHVKTPNIKAVSKAVISIRESKLPNPKDIGNSGSFFKNPIISKADFNLLNENFKDIPSYPLSNNEVKVPAGWLIEKAGFKGKRIGDYGVHKNQALVLVNYGNAKGEDILNLSKLIQKTVKRLFNISIETEVNII